MQRHITNAHKAGASNHAHVKPLPSQTLLRECFDYDPATGVLVWRWLSREHFTSDREQRRRNGRFAGEVAFNTPGRKGFYGRLFGERWFTHRVIWKWVYGADPEFIDHIDGNGFNNRIDNLRSVDVATNNRNMSVPKRNKSGFIGVRKSDKSDRWQAFITFQGKRHNLGTFDSKIEAVAARVTAERRFGFHPNHGRNQETLEPRTVSFASLGLSGVA